MNILLVDDDSDDQALLSEALAAIAPGTVCDFARNGVEGLKKLEACAEPPALIFLDINMPMMDGFETLRAIRSTPRSSKLEVVVYTTSSDEDDEQRCTSLGAKFISKPNSYEEIVERIRDVVRSALVRKESGKNSALLRPVTC